jgi:adenosine deaminase CECR1
MRLYGMGGLCSILKDGEEAPGRGSQEIMKEKPHLKISKMTQLKRAATRSEEPWRVAISKREFNSPDEYTKALEDLQLAEKERAFDAAVEASATELERRAAEILSRIRNYDREHVYGKALDTNGQPTGKRRPGGHFLGNLDLINNTELMKIAKRMPKGAHLHIHFNSCLPARFLIQQARDIEAMYIRSTLPLTSPENLAASRISFMVMTEEEAAPLADLWSADYPSNGWMPYKKFQQKFHCEDAGRILRGTSGAESWLEQKMLFSEEETYSASQTARGYVISSMSTSI